jgi:hypothetical protein
LMRAQQCRRARVTGEGTTLRRGGCGAAMEEAGSWWEVRDDPDGWVPLTVSGRGEEGSWAGGWKQAEEGSWTAGSAGLRGLKEK